MLQKCSILKVAAVFFQEPTRNHYLIEISKKSGLAHTSVTNYLLDLKKNNIITKTDEKKGSRIFPVFKANLNTKEYKEFKTIYNLINLKESGLIDFLASKLMPNAMVLFGSFCKGEDTEESDIDLFLECTESKVKFTKFEKLFKRKIQLHFKEDFKKYPVELKNNITNGIVLHGYLEAY